MVSGEPRPWRAGPTCRPRMTPPPIPHSRAPRRREVHAPERGTRHADRRRAPGARHDRAGPALSPLPGAGAA